MSRCCCFNPLDSDGKQATGIEPASPAWEAGVLTDVLCLQVCGFASMHWQESNLPVRGHDPLCTTPDPPGPILLSLVFFGVISALS